MYSGEFLNSILKTYYNREDLNLKVNTILNIFGIAKSTLYEWIKNKPLIINGKRTFNKKYPLHEYDRLVVNHVIKNKIIDHQKIIDKVKNKYNKTISRNIIYKILKRNNITRKRVQTKKCNYRLQSKYDLQLISYLWVADYFFYDIMIDHHIITFYFLKFNFGED